MFKNLFKREPKKTEEEIRSEEYLKNLNTITEHFNGVRINETLVGKIRGARLIEDICVIEESDEPKYPTKSSIKRPKSFGNNLFAWIEEVRQEAKAIMIENRRREKEEEENDKNVKSERQEKAIKESKEFFINYGVLPKQVA